MTSKFSKKKDFMYNNKYKKQVFTFKFLGDLQKITM